MNVGSFSQKSKETFIGLLSAGCFLFLFGMFFIIKPNLFDNVVNFFKNFDIVQVPNVFSGISLPAPKNPAMHATVYSAVSQFCFAWGIFLIGLFIVRIFANSPLNKKTQTASDIVFWFVSGYLISEFLNNTTTRVMWFAFWAAILMLIGLTLIIRGIILAVFG
jgi:hypothetical protein